MIIKKLLISILLSFVALSLDVWSAEDGENLFELEWLSAKAHFPFGIQYTLWDCVTLPDFNDNGRNELFIAADDPNRGAWYFVVEAVSNDDYEIIWFYYIEDCLFSYVLNYTSAKQDIDGDGLPEIIAGVAQNDAIAGHGIWIWAARPSRGRLSQALRLHLGLPCGRAHRSQRRQAALPDHSRWSNLGPGRSGIHS